MSKKIKTKKERINCAVSLADCGDPDQWSGDFSRLPPNKVYNLRIDYPCTPTIFAIKTGKKGLSLINLMHKIILSYGKIYDNVDKYNVWGHDMDDLVIAEIEVNHKTKTISLGVDS
jgi:hypothetical protein